MSSVQRVPMGVAQGAVAETHVVALGWDIIDANTYVMTLWRDTIVAETHVVALWWEIIFADIHVVELWCEIIAQNPFQPIFSFHPADSPQ